MSRLATRLVAALAPVVLLLPGAAHAEKVVTEDPAGDVVTLTGDVELEEAVLAPDHAGADIVRTVVALGENRLRLDVHFRALGRDPFHFTVARIRTPRGAYDLVVERLGGAPIASLERRSGTVECRGLRAKVALRTDTVSATMPAACLEGPRWVQVGVGAVAVDADQASPDLAAAYADDGHRAGGIRDDLAFGPKVRRG
jgi:hypothetical protein